jgi:hypothetical protein
MYLRERFLTSSEFHLYFMCFKASMATDFNQTFSADSRAWCFGLNFRTLMAETVRVCEASLGLNHLLRCLGREYSLYLLKEFGYVSAKNMALALRMLYDSYRVYYYN